MSNELTQQIINAVLATATPILVGLVMALLLKLLKRFNFSLEAEQQAKIEALVRRAILRVEEIFAAKVKAGVRVTAADKLESAIAEVTGEQPSLTRSDAAALIHAQLPLMRAAVPFGGTPGTVQ
jgi:hypothetical protein